VPLELSAKAHGLGRPTPTGAATVPLTGDLPQGEVVWTQGSLADLQGRPIRLQFTLRNGSLYSYWITERKPKDAREYTV
jgi:hypothetical protein